MGAKSAGQTVLDWIMDWSKPVMATAFIAAIVFFFTLWSRIVQIETKSTYDAQLLILAQGQHKDEHSKGESQRRDDFARLEKAIERIEARFPRFSDSGYSTYSAVSMNWNARYRETNGTVLRVGKDSITLESTSKKIRAECSYPVAVGARVLVKGRSATLDDLKQGMTIVMLQPIDGSIELIEAVDPPELITSPPRVETPSR